MRGWQHGGMIFLRSLTFATFFYVFTAICAVLASIISVVAPRHLPGFAAQWSRAWLAVYRLICGVTYEVRGREHLPGGGCILAMKHQSVWDTCAMFAIFDRPVYVLKRELMFIPFFGWALARLGCIPVKRGTGRAALETMIGGTGAALADNKQVVIFPEGTRTMVGDAPNYKSGISHLYKALNTSCVPVALNSGLLWPRRKFLRPPGVVRIEILPPIPAGLSRKEMFGRMVATIEEASQRLYLMTTP
jgi:1-acyl-sn-glycerol-3-phosphate acyltransferase